MRTLSLTTVYSHNKRKAIDIGEKIMISYEKLWQTMKEKGISQYDLYTHYGINRSQLDRLRKNKNIETNTIDRLCNILRCNVEDIMTHIQDDNSF